MYCRRLRINKKDLLQLNGPVLICCNHPNSFLDAIVISALFKKPIYSLARGDVFKHSLISRILNSLKMFPVFRNTEGAENMGQNYDTFDACKEIFQRNGIVLIFSEGRCINEWHLRKLMKGTARLALSSWEAGIPLKILPTGINYQSFTRFGKNIELNFGSYIKQEHIIQDGGFGKTVQQFNDVLTQQLQLLVHEIDSTDLSKKKAIMGVDLPVAIKLTLLIPAGLGWLLNLPLWLPLKLIAKKYGANNGHYDSILVGLLFIFYPIFLLLLGFLIAAFIGVGWALAFVLLSPLLGWSYMYIKPQF
jgi:1-acyl-sn-glycerol-3-phosphate acyltransferase